MRILLVISSLAGGGAERAVTTLSRMWAEHGDEVRVITISSSTRDVYQLDARVSRAALDLERKSSSAVGAFWNSVLRLMKLRRQIRDFNPDAVVAFMPPASILSAIAAIGTRVKVVGCERTYPPQAPLGPMRELARRWGYGLLDVAIAQTRECADWLRSNTWVRAISVIPNPATWPLPNNPPTVPTDVVCRAGRQILLAAGRLEAEKGFSDLLSAFASVCGECSEWDLVVVGEGSLRQDFEQFVADHRLVGRVHLPGRVGNVADWYARADLFALSSTFEGFPNALVEALAHGVPAVSYDCDTGPRDIIRHDVDGLLVPNGQPQELAKALKKLMGNEGERKRMAQRAVEIRERLAPDAIARDWNNLLQSLVHG